MFHKATLFVIIMVKYHFFKMGEKVSYKQSKEIHLHKDVSTAHAAVAFINAIVEVMNCLQLYLSVAYHKLFQQQTCFRSFVHQRIIIILTQIVLPLVSVHVRSLLSYRNSIFDPFLYLSLSLPTILASSPMMAWLLSTTWSVIADLCTVDCDTLSA